ncbi:Ff.00g115720.m01.CDS01 [Fusarium sp. VM40]|nr:Ff.00g115720.m01.CDS01 [Fusarium sp. VM40]
MESYVAQRWGIGFPDGCQITKITITISLLALLYMTAFMIWNVFFHPLAHFPGPLLARSSLLWRIYHSLGGQFHLAIQEQHKRLGPIIRVSPNELSFSSVESWKDIYGHATQGRQTMAKSEFYDMYGSGFESSCIGSERDPRKQSGMKKTLSGAFSTKALSQQECIVQNCVDGFVRRLGQDGCFKQGLNMTKWFEMIAFDILGEMAFGETFHCIETGKSHFWSDMIVEHLFFITVLDNLRRFPLLTAIGRRLLPKLTVHVRDKHSGYSRNKVARRLDAEKGRHDFLTVVAGKVKRGEISQEEMTAHASTLVIAGGETVATFLAGVTYFLVKTPAVYERLRAEIRGSFASTADITAILAAQLPYLQAVIAEGLRIYPPGSQGFPRICPGATIAGSWVPKGTEVYTSVWTVTHDENNFHLPYEFKPERWLDKSCNDNLEASQPFSLGPRGCVGKNFAIMEIGLILSKLHYDYDLELVDDQLDWLGQSRMHVMWWKPSLNVRFRKVNGSD